MAGEIQSEVRYGNSTIFKGATDRRITDQVKPRGDFVFSATGARAINDFADAKSKFDKACGVSKPWRLHDLRRTARTLLSRAGVRPDVGEMALGHKVGGIRARYDKFEFLDEKREAFEALSGLVERIVRPVDTVVAISTGRRK